MKLLNFQMEVANVLQEKAYDLSEERRCPLQRTGKVKKDLKFIQTLTNEEKDTCKVKSDYLMC